MYVEDWFILIWTHNKTFYVRRVLLFGQIDETYMRNSYLEYILFILKREVVIYSYFDTPRSICRAMHFR